MRTPAPDFACTDLGAALLDEDLRFLVEHFPRPGRSYEEMMRVMQALPSTLESILGSEWVVQKIFDRRTLLPRISPFLLFNVLLRRCLPAPRNALERAVIVYLSNLLSLFVRADRVFRVQAGDEPARQHLVDLMAEAAKAESRRRFLIDAHIGNYALYLSGLFADWLEHRRRYGKRVVGIDYYADLGRSHYRRASAHALARAYRLDEVFLRLALAFEEYRRSLRRLAHEYLASTG